MYDPGGTGELVCRECKEIGGHSDCNGDVTYCDICKTIEGEWIHPEDDDYPDEHKE